MSTESSEPQSDMDEPNTVLTPVRAWVAAHPVAAAIVAALIVSLIGIEATRVYWWVDPESASERNDFLRTAAALLGAAFVVTSLYFTRETLKTNQRSVAINQETVRINAQNTQLLAENQHQVQLNQLAERFFNASQQLGSESLHSRLGALYMLESIANESDRDYDQVVALIEAFLRERAPITDTLSKDLVSDPRFVTSCPEEVQVAITILGRRRKGYPIRETRRPDLSRLNLMNVKFTDCNFAGSDLTEAVLRDAELSRGSFSNADFTRCDLTGVHLFGADLSHSDFYFATLDEAKFAYFGNSEILLLKELNLYEATLNHTEFRIKDLSMVRGLSLVGLSKAHLLEDAIVPSKSWAWDLESDPNNPVELRYDLEPY